MTLVISGVFASPAFASDKTIDSTYKYAWGENVGWINFGTSEGNVHVTDSALTGYAWGENVGWISLNCSNDSSCGTVDYKVSNDGEGNLSGYAWSENTGWINFNPTYGGVSINSSDEFVGYAWGENIGWISFNCANTSSCGTVDFKVKTGSGGGGSGTGGGTEVSSRSDTLSDSRPSATSNHAFAFTLNTAIVGQQTLTLTFPSGFAISGSLDCGDVDAATSSQFNFNYPACAATATAWGFSAAGSVATLTAPTDSEVHAAPGTQITVKIGTNATWQQQGVHRITNPSAAGAYTISVGGTFGGSGNMLVFIQGGILVTAAVPEEFAVTVSGVPAASCSADDGASVTPVDSTSTTIAFGNVSANTFYIACQDVEISTNAAFGYSATCQEQTRMKTSGGVAIPDTTCDNGSCTESAGAAWTDASKNGFGHTCRNQVNNDCVSAYANGTKFRQFADISLGETAQEFMASSTTATAKSRVKFRLSPAAGQAAGAYITTITYIITPTF
jgi:hypothetical protein